MPALLMSTSTLPNSSMAAATTAVHDSGSLTSACTARQRRPTASTFSLVACEPIDAPRADDHIGAGLRKRLGEVHPEPRGGAGDDDDLVVETEAVEDAHDGPSFMIRP